MDSHKISFIICCNDKLYRKECELYINQLNIPEGYTIDIHAITGASSMAAGYNHGMKESDAKYKVYLHQDVFIINKDFLKETLSHFQHHPEIGMLGMVGTKRLPSNGCMWTTPMRTGAVRCCIFRTNDEYFDIPVPASRPLSQVQAIDGLLMMTQYDIRWREDLFTGWDFYDVSQSMEFTRQGYRIAIPYQQTPWVMHDNDFVNLSHYHSYRKIFLQEYFPEAAAEIAGCDKIRLKRPEGLKELTQNVLELITKREYGKAKELVFSHFKEYQADETFYSLYVLLYIYQEEASQGMPSIFSPLDTHDTEWIFLHYQTIRLYLMRLYYRLPEECVREAAVYFEQMNVSQTAVNIIYPLIAVAEKQ